MPGDKIKVLVAIADVDSSIVNGCALDEHACHNTTSVYTAAEIFPMLPEKVSTGITSLNFNEERLSIVVEMLVGVDGSVEGSYIYRAWRLTGRSLLITAWQPGWKSRPPSPNSLRR